MKQNKKTRAEARDMAEHLAEEARILQEKGEERLKNIDANELSPSDVLIFLTEGINLEQASLDIMVIPPSQLIEPTEESLAPMEKELERLKSVNVSKLAHVETLRFLITCIKLEEACRGIPENVANAHHINFD